MNVRLATVDDAAGIARVHQRGWRFGYVHIFPRDALDRYSIDTERWRARLAEPAPRSAVLVAVDERDIRGFAIGGLSRDEDGAGELYAIYVDPDAWGRGIGRALIARVEGALRRAGFDEATVWLLDENPRARRFYEAGGWRLDGVTKEDELLGVRVREVRYRKRLG